MKKRSLQSQVNPAQQISQLGSAPAPVGGWNARDSIANMDPRDATILDNFFPSASSVDLRPGNVSYATGFATRVQTMMSYASPTVQKLFACNSVGIFDITAGGAIGAAVTALTIGSGQYANFSTAAGSFMMFVNGADKPRLYDGAVWESVDGGSAHAITGITTTSIVNINSFKNRLWFCLTGSLDIYYLPVASIGGAATVFPLGGLFTRGGFLEAMGTWTIDGGAGVDDLAVFVTSEGEMAVYKGTDPSSPTTWALVGIFYIGEPIGRRCFVKYGGDLLFLCKQGLYPISKALQSASIDKTVALSDKINQAFSSATSLYGANLGWQMTVFPSQNAIIVNIPTFVGTATDQYVMNTLTQSWCRFQGWNAGCFIVWKGNLYFGSETTVMQAWTGPADNGAYITGVALTAYSYLTPSYAPFMNQTGLKHFKLIRPVLLVNGAYDLYIGVNVDFDDSQDYSIVLASQATGSLWDTALWDTGVFGSGPATSKQWNSVGVNDGYAVAAKMQIRSKIATVKWQSTDFVYERGGVI
jgi:uncharacterized protein YaiE (UPF0345 family)